MTEQASSTASLLLKYFLHGLAFSLIMLVMSSGLAFLMVFLVVFGFIIGLIMGFLILLVVYAGINAYLMDRIWDVPIKTDWKSLLAHGLFLMIALVLVAIPLIVISSLMQNIIVSIAMMIIYCPIDGYIAKNIAQGWTEEDIETAGLS